MKYLRRIFCGVLFAVTAIWLVAGTAFAAAPETIVYVTSSGECYHREGCSYLKSSNEMTLAQAVAAGYRPCSRCDPPELDSDYTEEIKSSNELSIQLGEANDQIDDLQDDIAELQDELSEQKELLRKQESKTAEAQKNADAALEAQLEAESNTKSANGWRNLFVCVAVAVGIIAIIAIARSAKAEQAEKRKVDEIDSLALRISELETMLSEAQKERDDYQAQIVSRLPETKETPVAKNASPQAIKNKKKSRFASSKQTDKGANDSSKETLDIGKWQNINSKLISRVKYEDGKLFIKFMNGAVYCYLDVPEGIFQEWYFDRFPTVFFQEQITPNFAFIRVDKPEVTLSGSKRQYIAETDSATVVYITDKGKCYHTANCREAIHGRPVPLRIAKELKRNPCRACHPPV